MVISGGEAYGGDTVDCALVLSEGTITPATPLWGGTVNTAGCYSVLYLDPESIVIMHDWDLYYGTQLLWKPTLSGTSLKFGRGHCEETIEEGEVLATWTYTVTFPVGCRFFDIHPDMRLACQIAPEEWGVCSRGVGDQLVLFPWPEDLVDLHATCTRDGGARVSSVGSRPLQYASASFNMGRVVEGYTVNPHEPWVVLQAGPGGTEYGYVVVYSEEPVGEGPMFDVIPDDGELINFEWLLDGTWSCAYDRDWNMVHKLLVDTQCIPTVERIRKETR